MAKKRAGGANVASQHSTVINGLVPFVDSARNVNGAKVQLGVVFPKANGQGRLKVWHEETGLKFKYSGAAAQVGRVYGDGEVCNLVCERWRELANDKKVTFVDAS